MALVKSPITNHTHFEIAKLHKKYQKVFNTVLISLDSCLGIILVIKTVSFKPKTCSSCQIILYF